MRHPRSGFLIAPGRGMNPPTRAALLSYQIVENRVDYTELKGYWQPLALRFEGGVYPAGFVSLLECLTLVIALLALTYRDTEFDITSLG